VRVLPLGSLPELRNVRGTMFCDIALVKDERAGRLIILSAIDNLCRGASGQAIANANLMFGLSLEAGLKLAPAAP
jgi:N-acetyl-gamma-glutamyl-phosphate reductase